MARNTLMMVYFGVDFLFLASGALILGFTIHSEQSMRATPTTDTVAQHVLLRQCPLTAGIVNAVLIFATFLASLPALFLPANRAWLRAQGWMVTITGVFTLALGIVIWVETLQTRSRLFGLWQDEAPLAQSLLQEKFDCCGYISPTEPPFVLDNTCSSGLVAAQKGGCIEPFSRFSNSYLDKLFTALFGVVAIDVILILCVAMVLKQRAEYARYRIIDMKNGTRAL